MMKTLSVAELGGQDSTASMNESSSSVDETSTTSSEWDRSQKGNDNSFMVYAVLFIATLVFGAATYLMVASNQAKFQAQFDSYSREFTDIAMINTMNVHGQLRSLSASITAEAIDRNGFPNVTIRHFDIRTQEIADMTGVDMVLFVPLVEQSHRSQWESHAIESQGWIVEDYEQRGWDESKIASIPENIHECSFCINSTAIESHGTHGSTDEILTNLGYDSKSFSVPISQYGPGPVDSSLSMFDLFSHPSFNKEFLASLEYGVPVTTEANNDLSFLLDYIQASDGDGNHSKEALRTMVIHPVKEDLRKDSRTVGFLVGIVTWQALFEMGLPAKVNGIDVVVESDCGFVFTYTANGGGPSTTANGDIHDPRYNELGIRYPFLSMDTMSHPEAHHAEGSSELCEFELAIYPTDTFRSSFESTDPSIYSGLIVVVFVCIAAVFFLYDKFTQTRQDEVASQAKRAEAIVTSVFPKGVGMRLIKQAEREQTGRVSDKTMLNNFLAKNGDMGQSTQRSKPIADLFPSTTVMFGDIVGFTAWSSMREPSQVFILLESIYKEFDALAKRRKVFKVETVGDCYVAVCGLPNPRKDHSVVMSRFASDCISRMAVQVQALEVELGPDTADLGIRIGLHSGPVTAGVLRGDRARFQLFGDTVNTCARIESTGWKDKIHLSKETADHLNEMGKGHWYFPRVDKVTAKGKGELETFWLKNIRGNKGSDAVDGGSVVSESFMTSQETSTSVMDVMNSPKIPQSRLSMQGTIQRKMQDLNPKKFDRLVSWNVDVLLTFLTQVEERRQQTGIKADAIERIKTLENEPSGPNTETGTTTLDEVVGVIELPRFDSSCSKPLREKVELGWQVRDQLKEYVTLIASMYNDNPFHNFEHASHVTMSVMKLLSRIVGPDLDNDDARELHDHTYGITSDPLTQFAVVLSALLHDVDHLGVPNTQLVKEAREISQMYNNKSVAEQNSIDLAWSLLMEDRFQVLRRAIYSTEAEFRRFRQLLVNTILATDIMDKDLKSMRNAKWDKAFAESFLGPEEGMVEINNRKATVVIEHLIQASDVAHTMQHWQVYRKWNGRLFKELYRSYSEGHSDKDPSEGWYEGEMGFFDFYILPLAKKLHDCGVFGVASHEYLNYAEQNRREWEAKGKSVVAEFIKEIEAETLARRPKGLSSTGIGASNV